MLKSLKIEASAKPGCKVYIFYLDNGSSFSYEMSALDRYSLYRTMYEFFKDQL